jgi:hypothetical protein
MRMIALSCVLTVGLVVLPRPSFAACTYQCQPECYGGYSGGAPPGTYGQAEKPQGSERARPVRASLYDACCRRRPPKRIKDA